MNMVLLQQTHQLPCNTFYHSRHSWDFRTYCDTTINKVRLLLKYFFEYHRMNIPAMAPKLFL